MRKKHASLLVSDYDGTLCQQGEVSAEDQEVLRAWRSQGNLFAIATGRGFSSIANALAAWPIHCDYLICVNGAEIYDGAYSLLHTVTFSLQNLQPTWHCLQDFAEEMVAVSGKVEYTLPLKDRMKVEEDMISQLSICYPDRNTAWRAADTCDGVLPSKLRLLRNGRWINIVSAEVDKSTAIEVILQSLGNDREAPIVIGDDLNDMEMISRYGGYAIEASPAAYLLPDDKQKTCSNVSHCIQLAYSRCDDRLM